MTWAFLDGESSKSIEGCENNEGEGDGDGGKCTDTLEIFLNKQQKFENNRFDFDA
jgi:hypothetical protein